MAELIKRGGVVFALKGLGMAATYAFMIGVVELLGLDVWGKFAAIQSLCLIVLIFGRFGLQNSLVKLVASNKGNGPTFFGLSIGLASIITITLTLLIYALAPFITQEIYDKPEWTSGLRIGILAIPFFAGVSVVSAYIRGIGKVRQATLLEDFIRPVMVLAVFAIVYLTFETNSNSVISSWVIAIALSMVSAFIFLKIIDVPLLNKEKSTDYGVKLKELVQLSWPMLFTNSLVFINGKVDILMLGRFETEANIGLYDVAFKITLVLAMVLMAARSAYAPDIARHFHDNNKKALRQLVQKTTRMAFLVSVVLSVGVFAIALGLPIIFGDKYNGLWIPALILIGAQLVNAGSGIVGVILNMTGKEVTLTRLMVLVLILNIILNAILIPKFGIIGAAWATAISMVIRNICASWLIKKHLGFYAFGWR